MASPAYEQILRVQGLDLDLRRLRHQHQHHAVREEVAGIDARIAEVDVLMTEIGARHHELERQRKRLEDEAATIAAKRVDIDKKLYGGEITASKELLALQDEATMLLAKQTELEDQELELMEALEAVDAERSAAGGNRNRLSTARSEAAGRLRAAVDEIDTELADTEVQRDEAAKTADPNLLATYESLRNQFDGVAVARLVNGACDGCHIRLSAIAIDQLGKMPDDVVVTCEECGRLLVR
jgi:predicted  nucleic acid-binding Zn-ribbon protein